MKLACVMVTPAEARVVLGGCMHAGLALFCLPHPRTDHTPFWVTVAEVGGAPVAAHAFKVRNETHGTRGTLCSFSTYALKRVRGKGIGSQLWSHSLKFTEAAAVAVTVVSSEGARLIRRVQAEHPDVAFYIDESIDDSY